MAGVTTVDFDRPDETRSFTHGKVDIVRVGASSIARLSLQPGWHWAEDVKPIAGTETCQVRHVGYLVSGRMQVTTEDGTQLDIGPGESYVIEPGHYAEVVGQDELIALEFATQAVETFAKTAS
jgi:mannose-6-phosphate isomerase-like protein (cupin superfamily)